MSKVFEGDPADKAGIREGDVIVSIDGNNIETSRQLSRTVAGLDVGKKTTVTLKREGKTLTRKVTLGKRADENLQASNRQPETREELGIEVTTLRPEMARRLGVDENETGVLVTEVRRGSKAGEAGVRPGDLIKEINRQKVEGIQDFQKLLASAEKKKEGLNMLLRRPRAGYVAVTIDP